MGLDEPVGRAPQLLGEEAQEDVLHTRVLPLQPREVVPEDRAGLAVLERFHRRGAARVEPEQRELAEALARPEDVDQDTVPERSEDARAEAAANHEVQRVRRILAVKDDLAPLERPPAGDREQLADVLGREIGEQRPVHDAEVSVTAVTFATSRARTTRPRAGPRLRS